MSAGHHADLLRKSSKTIVVTGGSAGVGRAIASAFAREGWQVAVLARGQEGLDGTVREIEEFGARALGIQADVADAEAVMRAAKRIEAELGEIDVWVNNAMVTIYGAIHDITPEEFLQVTRVTYLGQVHGILAALQVMRPRNRGTILCIGSALAYRSIPFQGPYCAAKAAVRGIVDSLRSELISENSAIRISLLNLPAVNTPQFDWARNKLGNRLKPVPPIYQPEAIAAAVVRAAHTAPREYWIGGAVVKALVGQMLMPSVADRLLGRKGPTSETTGEPDRPGRPDNLFEAGRGDPGAHGRFDALSSGSVVPFNPALLRGGLAAFGFGAIAAGLALALRRDGR